MKIVKQISELKKAISEFKYKGTVGFVPTMGALHSGHISLVEECRKNNGVVVVSIFVNPTQFNDKNDLIAYPRTEAQDAALLEKSGCDIIFMPTVEEIYPTEDNRIFDFSPLDEVMEGVNRPGHFNGVGQIVSKLFDYVAPDNAYFGEKDFQQLAIIRKMTKDLGYNINIVGCPICRDVDGLALSSRNMLLSKEQRAVAPHIYSILSKASKMEWNSAKEAESWVVSEIEKESQFEVEYFTIADEVTLRSIKDWNQQSAKRGFVVVKVGKIRLIDNIGF